MKLRGKIIPVLVEIMPGVTMLRKDIPGLPERRPRAWMPRIRKRPKK